MPPSAVGFRVDNVIAARSLREAQYWRYGIPGMLFALACAILLIVPTVPAQVASRPMQPLYELIREARVQKALAKLGNDASAITEEQIRITEIPAPTFREGTRGAYVGKLLSAAGLTVSTDSAGNVIGERAGSDRNSVILVTAHLDTVFPADTNVRVRREGGRLMAPGISDNGTGLAGMLAIARVLHDLAIATRGTVIFAADVGEEGEGNLNGVRKLVETYRSQLRYVIALDGSSIDYIATGALASVRVEMTITGPGGHSWSDFGVPNPIHAMARGIARFVTAPLASRPRSSYNVGEIEGGTSVNSIPNRASIKVDLRSESETELSKLEVTLRDAIQAGVTEEMDAARKRGVASGNGLALDVKVLGVRPGGELPANSPLLTAVQAADDYLGVNARLERSSTDANIPLSLGIPALSIGAGGRSGGAHTLAEWYDPAGRELGLRRVLLTILQLAQLAGPGGA